MAFETRPRQIEPAGPRRIYVVEYQTPVGTRRERVLAAHPAAAIARAQRVFGGSEQRIVGREI